MGVAVGWRQGHLGRSAPPTRSRPTSTTYKADVANVIPPQKAGRIAEIAGVADRTGWCPIDPVTFESKLQARHPRHRRCGDRRRDAEIGVRRQRAGQGLRRRDGAAAARGETPDDAAADQHLLQPGGARLRHLGRRRLSPARTASWPKSRAPAAPARSTRRVRCASRKPARRRLVQHHHRARSSAERWHAGRRIRDRLAAVLRCSPGRADEGCGPIPSSATPSRSPSPARPAIPRAAAPSSTTGRSGFACCAIPARSRRSKFQGNLAPDLAGVGSRWCEGQLRLRMVDARRLNPDTIMPAYYRVDGLERVAPAFRGKPC